MTFLEKFSRRLGVLEYLGTWNAQTNTPALASGVGQRGGYYVVSTGGATNLDGETSWNPGDWAIFNGVASKWEKLDNTDEVTSVAGRKGAVTLSSADLSDFSGAVDSEILPKFIQYGLRYVSTTGDNAHASGSYAAPFGTIAAALSGAPSGSVIVLFPGIYSEPTVNLPSNVVIRGMGSGAVELANGFSHIAASGDNVGIQLEGINFGSLTLNETLASNGTVTLKETIGAINRIDSSATFLVQMTESAVVGGSLSGGAHTFNECLLLAPITVSGGLAIFENCKFIATLEAEGSATIRTLHSELFSATAFVHGTTVSGHVPTWETDLATEFLGGYTGTVSKVRLAAITASDIGLGNVDNVSAADLRDRATHTGTQAASTISDFVSEAQSAVVVQSISGGDTTHAPSGDVVSTAIGSETSARNEIYQVTGEPTGFVNRVDSEIAFDEPTRTFSIFPTSSSFDVWIQGAKQTISTTLTVQIPDTSGTYFFYIDTDGSLQYQTTFDITLHSGKAYTAFVYWDAVTGKATTFGEERHGIAMDNATVGYLHRTRGTQLVSGAAISYLIGTGSSPSDAQVAIGDAQVQDEDIIVNVTNSETPSNPFEQKLSPIALIPILYREGTVWKKSEASKFPMLTGPNRTYFNELVSGSWQLTEAPANNKVCVTYLFATTDRREPIVGILGQSQYQDVEEARALAAWDQISFGDLPAQELKLIYVLYYKTSSNYTNDAKAAIEYVGDTRFNSDRQVSASVFNGAHANLSGLLNDDHPQYLATSGIREMTGALNLGTHAITNVTTVNGVTVEAHGSRHAGNGADPVPSATTLVSGLMSSTDKSKLDGIAPGATANQTDAYLLDRAHHTGTQTASTISDFTSAVQGVTIDASKIDGGVVSNAEFATLDGITTGTTIQAQLNAKQATITGGATTITSSDLTASRALVSDASGKVAVSAATSTEVGYLSGVSSGIQSQISGKQATITGAATTITSSDLTVTRALVSDGSGKVAVSATTSTEIGYVSGVTSGIQSQLSGKEPTVTAGTTSQYWRGDKTFQTLDKTAVGLSNVDNISAANLRDRTTHTGNETTLTWTETTEPAAPASGLTIYAESVGGREMFAQVPKAGKAYPFQPSLGAMATQAWFPNANAATSTIWGQVAPTANGTATARTVATTNSFTWQRRVGFVSGNAAGSTCGLRSAVLQFGTGNGAGLGGFFFQTRFGISDATLGANARSAVGLTATTGAFANADPSTFLNFLGMAHDAADTNWQIMFNDGTGTATKVDLGTNFTRSPAVSTAMYDLVLYCAPNTTTIFYEVKNLANGAVATGTMTTNIPANTQLLTWQHWRSNNATGSAVALDIAQVYIETDY